MTTMAYMSVPNQLVRWQRNKNKECLGVPGGQSCCPRQPTADSTDPKGSKKVHHVLSTFKTASTGMAVNTSVMTFSVLKMLKGPEGACMFSKKCQRQTLTFEIIPSNATVFIVRIMSTCH